MTGHESPRTSDVPPRDQHGLSEVEEGILAMEQSWWKYQGAKETAVRDAFDMSLTRYYQVLNALIEKPAALAADPVTVNRLRRIRAERQAQRSDRSDRAPGA